MSPGLGPAELLRNCLLDWAPSGANKKQPPGLGPGSFPKKLKWGAVFLWRIDSRVPAPEGVAVLLLGNAGATFRQLERHSELYNTLGFRTLACTLPLQFVFHYDIPNTVRFCKQVTANA